MAGKQNGHPLFLCQSCKKPAQRPDSHRVQPVRRFVQNQKPGAVDHGACDGKPLAHSERKGGYGLLSCIGKPHPFQRLPNLMFLFPGKSHIGQMQSQIIHGGQMLIENRRLDQATGAPENLLFFLHAVETQHLRPPCGWSQHAEKQLEQRGFPRAVSADQAVDDPLLHPQVYVLHHLPSVKGPCQLSGYHCVAHNDLLAFFLIPYECMYKSKKNGDSSPVYIPSNGMFFFKKKLPSQSTGLFSMFRYRSAIYR